MASLWVRITSWRGYSFQALMKVKMARAPKPGLMMGKARSEERRVGKECAI